MEITISLNDDQLEELFENADIKFSKAKLNKLKKKMKDEDFEGEANQVLEEAFLEFLEETIEEEWGD